VDHGVDRGDGGDPGEPECGALDEVDRLGQRGQADGCGPSTRPPNVKMASVPAGQGYVVGLQDLTWDLILISSLQPACSPGSPRDLQMNVPLVTASYRSVAIGCDPNMDQGPSRSRGQRRSAWRTLAGKVDPRRLPPTSEPRRGDRLVRGSPGGVWARDIPLYRRAVLASGMVIPQRCACSNHTGDGGWLADMAVQISSSSGIFAGCIQAGGAATASSCEWHDR
jgi:hypothetical protein